MATYFVASGGSNTAPYDTWAKAATSLQTALTAASTGGDIVVIQYNGVPTGDAEQTVDTTYTFASDCSLIAASNDGGSAYTPTVMDPASNWIGNSTVTRGTTFAGAFSLYIYGIALRNFGSAVSDNFIIGADGGSRKLESCTFRLGATGSASTIRLCGPNGASVNSHVELSDCVFWLGNTTHSLAVGGGCRTIMTSCSLHASSSVPATLFEYEGSAGIVKMDGCDWSLCGAAMAPASAGNGWCEFILINCKIPASWSLLPSQTPANLASGHVYVYNCSDGDTHYHFGYYNAFGSVVAVSGKYASGGAKYDGTNGVSWQIDTTANAAFGTPFVTPWIDLYHSGTSAITPSLEILRDGSATAYDNDEVWAEFSYQGTSGSTKATFVDDRMAVGGTPAAQTTGSLGAGDWTGEGGTAWFGKLNPASAITPAEIGMLRARVCVGLQSATVYVDPYIRT